jgi:hypothetical protein
VTPDIFGRKVHGMGKNILRSSVMIVVLLACGAAARAQSQVFVSAATGNDANQCTRSMPCLTLAGGLTHVQAGGTVTALDSGEYGSMTVNQSVQIEAAPGVRASVTATGASYGVTVNAGTSNVVVLRGLRIGGGYYGVYFNGAGTLDVEDCVLDGSTNGGIMFLPNAASQLFVNNTTVRNTTNGTGIQVQSDSGLARATISHCLIEKSSNAGVSALNYAAVTVRDTVVTGNTTAGFLTNSYTSGATTEMSIENCLATGGKFGIEAVNSNTGAQLISVSRSISAGNYYGIYAGNPSTIRVSDTTITRNTDGLINATGGSLLSRLNNTLEANTYDGAFTGTFGAK